MGYSETVNRRRTDNEMAKRKQTKHYKIKNRAKRMQPKAGVEFRFSGKVSSSSSTYGTRRVTLVTNPVINHDWTGLPAPHWSMSIYR